jgi:hypothetical protein
VTKKEGTVIGSKFCSRASRRGRLQTNLRSTRRLAAALWTLGFVLLAPFAARFDAFVSQVSAQDSNASDWGGGPADNTQAQCTPKCRRGHECRHGECIPICAPACGPGFLCTSGGACVRTDAPEPVPVQAAPSSGWGASSSQCLPSCRTGYLCVSGQCMSACNPLCPAGEMCTERGECVPAGSEPNSSEPGKTEPEKKGPVADEKDSSADSIVNLHADVLGLLQFGLTPTLEVGGKHVAGYVRVRPLNTGLLSYFLLDHKADDVFKWGIGGALGLHIFSAGAGNMRGLFGGVALEYLFGKNENTKRTQAIYKTHVLLPQLDIGYRWAFDRLLVGVGARIGVLLPVGDPDNRDEGRVVNGSSANGCVGKDACDGGRSILPIGGIFLDLGYFF